MIILIDKIVHFETLGTSVQKKTPFAKVTVYDVIDNLMEDSDDDDDEEVFDHDDCEAIFYVNNEDLDTESAEEDNEDDIFLLYFCDIKLFFINLVV